VTPLDDLPDLQNAPLHDSRSKGGAFLARTQGPLYHKVS
jgi:hypothetical protein